ncbi:MAG: FGGY family carbohydrate kinase [Geminicoccaceae bacterium]
MSADLVIGVDCSTTAAKAIVWDANGHALAEGRQGFGVVQEKPGWGEQEAEDWWRATAHAIAEATSQVEMSRIGALCVTHQRETFVCLDRDDQPIRPAMLWLDVRATAEVETFGNEDVHRITGKPANPTPAWYKLLWLARHEPQTMAKTAHVVDVAAYLVHRLTGEWATSWSSADPLGLVDLSTFDYDDGLLETAGLSRSQLPALVAPGDIAGRLSPSIAAGLGLPAGLPVIAGVGDGQSAGLGCNITAPGRAYLNVGTGVVSGTHADRYSHASAYRTMGSAVPGAWVLETFIGGGTHNIVWFVNQLAGIDSKSLGLGLSTEQLLEAAAERLPAGAEGLLCLPYWTGAMTPYWDGHARGALIGLSGLHGKAHIYRAILEGIAMEQRMLSAGAGEATGREIEEFVILGGGSRSRLWCRIFASALQRPVHLVREQESTALGAGVLAAAGCGVHSDILSAAAAMSGVRDRFDPELELAEAYDRLFETYRGIYPALRPTFAGLAGAMA